MKKLLLILLATSVIQVVGAGEFEKILDKYNAIQMQVGEALESDNLAQLESLANDLLGLQLSMGKVSSDIQSRLEANGISLLSINGLALNILERKEELGGAVLTVQLRSAERQLEASNLKLTRLQSTFDNQLAAFVGKGGDPEMAAEALLEEYLANPENRAALTKRVVDLNGTAEAAANEVLKQNEAGQQNDIAVGMAAQQIGTAKGLNKALIDVKDEEIHGLEKEKEGLEKNLGLADDEIRRLQEAAEKHQREVESYTDKISRLDEQVRSGEALSESQKEEYAKAFKEKGFKDQAISDAKEEIRRKKEEMEAMARRKAEVEQNIRSLKDEVESIKAQNKRLDEKLAQLAEAFSKLESVSSAFGKLLGYEAQLKLAEAEYERLMAIEAISNAHPDVRDRAIKNINESSSLQQEEKERLITELEAALDPEQAEKISAQKDLIRALYFDIEDTRALIRTLGKRAQERIQKVVAPYQTRTQYWWSGDYPEEGLEERDKNAILLAERALKQERALASVNYSATDALERHPDIFRRLTEDSFAAFGGVPAAGLGGTRQRRAIEGAAASDSAPGSSEQHAKEGEKEEKESKPESSRLNQLRSWASSMLSSSKTEHDLLKILAQAEREIAYENRSWTEELRQPKYVVPATVVASGLGAYMLGKKIRRR
ncbi:MAG TPA: hypothetical protein QGF02_03960 [Candidatus Babeliales bacterium]|nr:hypothetical protein [Candidatus Babeliales bacterium]